MYNNKDYYINLLTNYPEEVPDLHEKIINMDLPRTYQEENIDKSTMQKLKNILVAYSRRSSSIGYCQGFNFLAARVLSIIDNEEKAFWVFVQLIENLLPINYYSEMAGVMIDSTILNKLIIHYLPELYNYMKERECQIYLSNFIFKWLISLYVQSIPRDVIFIIIYN